MGAICVVFPGMNVWTKIVTAHFYYLLLYYTSTFVLGAIQLIFESGDIALHTFQIFIPVCNVTEYANFDFTANNMHTLFRSNSFVK